MSFTLTQQQKQQQDNLTCYVCRNNSIDNPALLLLWIFRKCGIGSPDMCRHIMSFLVCPMEIHRPIMPAVDPFVGPDELSRHYHANEITKQEASVIAFEGSGLASPPRWRMYAHYVCISCLDPRYSCCTKCASGVCFCGRCGALDFTQQGFEECLDCGTNVCDRCLAVNVLNSVQGPSKCICVRCFEGKSIRCRTCKKQQSPLSLSTGGQLWLYDDIPNSCCGICGIHKDHLYGDGATLGSAEATYDPRNLPCNPNICHEEVAIYVEAEGKFEDEIDDECMRQWHPCRCGHCQKKHQTWNPKPKKRQRL